MATRDKALEKLLTEANESAKAFAQFGGDLVAVRMRVLVSAYGNVVARLVEKLETDAAGRILTNAANVNIQRAIAEAGRLFTESATTAVADISPAGQAVAASISKTTATLRSMLKATAIDDAVVDAFAADSLAYGSTTFARGALRVATDISSQVTNIVTDALARYEGNKADLIGKLFSPDGLDNFRRRNAEMQSWAKGMAGKGRDYIDDLKAGRFDIAKIREEYHKQIAEYIEQRKGFLESGQTPSLFDDTKLETRTISDVKQQIMETHQDSINRAAANTLPADTLWVNAKNTGYPDNCLDAMEADPMTMAEWKASAFGLPRSPSRDCGAYCECLLFPVTPKIETGAGISAPFPDGAK